mgnify:CR=1 FL=1
MNRYDKGYISLYRKFKNWRFYKNDSIKAVFIHCLLSAYWKDEVITEYRGKKLDPPIKVPRGSFVTSRRVMAKELDKTEGQIREAWSKLSSDNLQPTDTTKSSTHEIDLTTTQLYTIIKVRNYNEFQPLLDVLQPTDNDIKNPQYNPTVQPQLNNININKDKKIERYKDISTDVHSNFNSLTLKLLKNGFINDDDIPELYDNMFNEFLEEYEMEHINVVVDYIIRKMSNRNINNKFYYFKKSLTINLKKMKKMIDQESASEESQAPIKMNNEELHDLLDQLREGKL